MRKRKDMKSLQEEKPGIFSPVTLIVLEIAPARRGRGPEHQKGGEGTTEVVRQRVWCSSEENAKVAGKRTQVLLRGGERGGRVYCGGLLSFAIPRIP